MLRLSPINTNHVYAFADQIKCTSEKQEMAGQQFEAKESGHSTYLGEVHPLLAIQPFLIPSQAPCRILKLTQLLHNNVASAIVCPPARTFVL